MSTRSNQHADSCYICQLVCSDAINQNKDKAGSKSVKKQKLCDKCLSPVGKGIKHKCKPSTLRANLSKIVPKPAQEQFAAKGNILRAHFRMTGNCV